MPMNVSPISVRKIIRPNEDLIGLLVKHAKLKDKDIVCISSKVASICKGYLLEKSSVKDRIKLVLLESDYFKVTAKNKTPVTIKEGILGLASGVDEFEDYFVLLPPKPDELVKNIRKALMRAFRIKQLGVILTDSRTQILRRGSIGVALGYAGLEPLRRYLGRRNIWGREMKTTQANVIDALASAAVLVMGEGGELRPFAVIRGDVDVKFTDKPDRRRGRYSSFRVPVREDIYSDLLKEFKKNTRGGK